MRIYFFVANSEHTDHFYTRREAWDYARELLARGEGRVYGRVHIFKELYGEKRGGRYSIIYSKTIMDLDTSRYEHEDNVLHGNH